MKGTRKMMKIILIVFQKFLFGPILKTHRRGGIKVFFEKWGLIHIGMLSIEEGSIAFH